MMRKSVLTPMLAAMLISLNACAGQADAARTGLTQAEVGGQQLSLSNEQGRCTLNQAQRAPLTLQMQWPCRFSEDLQKNARVETYRKALIVMVERSDPLPAPSKNCITDLQSVRLFNGKLEASPVSRIAACGPAHWDQKAFVWQFDW